MNVINYYGNITSTKYIYIYIYVCVYYPYK